MRTLYGIAVSLCLIALVPALAAAQAVSQRAAPVDGAAAAAGPRVENARVGITPAAAPSDATANESATAVQPARQRQGIALMAVGGAALLAGLIIGDDAGTAIAVSGVVIGLIGLYQYLR